MILNQPLVTGSIVSLWHGNRGHVYVVAGINRGDKTLDLIRHNCFNLDGTIHKSTIKAAKRRALRRGNPFHKTIPIEDFEGLDGVKVASKINRVFGTKEIDKNGLATFVRRHAQSTTLVELKASHEVHPPLAVTADHRSTPYFF